MMYASGYDEIKQDIIKTVYERDDDTDVIINVYLAPWANTEKFNDMQFFCTLYASQKNVTITVKRQSWLDFLKHSIF